jgi:hypothetical protein
MNPGCAILEPESENIASRKGKSRRAKGNASPLGRQAIEIIEREIVRFGGIVCFQRFDRFLISPFSAQDPPHNHKRGNVSRLPAPAHHSRQF